MLHLLGVHLPEQKIVGVALTYFYGIGAYSAQQLCTKLEIDPRKKISDLTETQINAISSELSTMTIETDLKRQMRGDIAHHRQIGTYRGRRHAMGLPVRGQNTQNNAQIAKRLNRLERRWYSVGALTEASTEASSCMLKDLLTALKQSNAQ